MARRRERKRKFAAMKDEELPNMMTAEALIASAKIAAAKASRLTAPAIKALTAIICDPENAPAPGTFAVDQYYRMYCSKDAIFAWYQMAKDVSPQNPCRSCGATEHHPIAYLGGAVAHEAWHPLRQHAQRFMDLGIPATDDVLDDWGISTDEEINDDLMIIFASENQPRLCIPPTHLNLPKHHGHPDHKLAEHYFFLHRDNPRPKKDGQKKPGQGRGEGQKVQSQGQQPGEGQGKGEGQKGEGQKGDKPGQQGEGQGQSGDQPGGGGQGAGQGQDDSRNDHGSAVDGQPRPWDLGEPKEGDVNTGISEVEARMVRKQVAKNIVQASKSRGTVPGGYLRWAEKQLEGPKYDWRAELAKALRWAINRRHGDSIRTFRRLSRRCVSIGYKAILPSSYDPSPTVCIVQDTSGSMSERAISESLAEAEAIVRATGAEVNFLACDMHADKVQRVSNVRTLAIHGGGGTDMRVGIRAALKSKPKPNVVVLFTDGFTPWPEQPLPDGTKLVVGLVGEHSCNINKPPAWATTVKILGDDIEVRQAETL